MTIELYDKVGDAIFWSSFLVTAGLVANYLVTSSIQTAAVNEARRKVQRGLQDLAQDSELREEYPNDGVLERLKATHNNAKDLRTIQRYLSARWSIKIPALLGFITMVLSRVIPVFSWGWVFLLLAFVAFLIQVHIILKVIEIIEKYRPK